jgi:fucose 4-O-acetylase-like acetyltransferase
MKNKEIQRVHCIDDIRAVAIFMVVCIHAFAYTHRLNEPLFTVMRFLVHTIPVPVFFFADGFLFAWIYKQKKFLYQNYVIKSCKRLIIPWLFFNVFYVILRYYMEYNNILSDKILVGRSMGAVIVAIYGSLVAAQLYFLVSLFLVRLLSIFTYQLITAKSGITILCVFFTCLFLYYRFEGQMSELLYIKGGTEPILHAAWGLQYYCFGIIIERYYKIVFNRAVILSCLSFLSMLIFLPFCNMAIGRIVTPYCYLTGLFTLILAISEKRNILSFIGKNTMGIYLLHNPIMLKGLSFIIPCLIKNPFLSYASMTTSAFAISLAASIILLKIPYAKILFGV